MAAGNAGMDRMDLAIGHQFGLFDRALDRLHRGLDIHHHALLQPARGMGADADDLDLIVVLEFADQTGDLRGADIQAHQQTFVVTSRHPIYPRLPRRAWPRDPSAPGPRVRRFGAHFTENPLL
jgi:hypothetical protein